MSDIKETNSRLLIFLGFFQFWVVNLFFKSPDKENYATTLLQYSRNKGIRSQFLGLDFADLGLAFGTNFPLLGYFDLTPLPYLASFLDIRSAWMVYVSFLVLLCNTILVRCFSQFLHSNFLIFILVSLITTLSPAWLDSNTYNDWPATWSAAVYTLMVWTMLFSALQNQKLSKSDVILIPYFVTNAFAADPGYFPILVLGVIVISLGFKGNDLKHQWVSHIRPIGSSYTAWFVFLATYFVTVTFELFQLNQGFESGSRSLADSPVYSEARKLIDSLDFSFQQRGLGPYVIFLAAAPIILILGRKRPIPFIRYVSGAFIFLIGALIPIRQIISEFDFNPDLLYFYPTAGFFLRDIAVFLILIFLTFQLREIRIWKSGIQFMIICILLWVTSNQLSFVESFRLDKVKQNVWLQSLSLEVLKPEKSNGNSRGVVFTELANSASRSSVSDKFWMSTDFQERGQRLLSASTKIQSKDFFYPGADVFQGTTIKRGIDYWCNSFHIKNFWVDFVVATKSEIPTGGCLDVRHFDVGDLRVYQVNNSFDLHHTVRVNHFSDVNTVIAHELKFDLTSDGRVLTLDFIDTPDQNTSGVREVRLPIQYSSNLRIRIDNNLVESYQMDDGFTMVRHNGEIKRIMISYEPKLTQKIRIYFTHLYSLILAIMFIRRRRQNS
jgi:hypothetical protein